MKLSNHLLCISLLTLLTACGGSNGGSTPSLSDTSGDVRFKATLTVNWTSSRFATQYPSNAHFSTLVGTVHNEQVSFWEVGGQPATDGIESMAESGSTSAISSEISTAKLSGYSQGVIQVSGISTGSGSTSVEFNTSDTYPLLTLVTMLAPSPDWFIGVTGLNLKDSSGAWISQVDISLPVYDAGTDSGITFTSSNSDTNDSNLPITLLTSNRSDTDFEDGQHHSSEAYIGTLSITRIE